MLNDLPYNERYKFILLSGILSIMKEPKPSLLNLVLKSTIINVITHLNNARLFIQMNDKKIYLRFSIHNCVVDSVCRPIVQNRILFNGYNGCSYCYQRGEYIHSVRGILYVFN